MKVYVLIFSLWTILFCSTAENTTENKVDLNIYGFVRNDFYIDTYQSLGAAKEQFVLAPKKPELDKNGSDINQVLSANMVSIMTRFGFKLNGPDIFNAKSTARFETDFLGNPGVQPYYLRIRLAYVELQWENVSILAGQDWHPFFTKKNYPKTVAINTGAPFNPFGRDPLVRLDYNVGKFIFSGAGLYELQFPTFGPLGPSTLYQSNGVIPELIVGAEFNSNGLKLGAMAAYKNVMPRIVTDSVYVTNQRVASFNYMGYAQYKTKKLELNAKATYGGLMSHLVAPGGYGVATYNQETGQETYTPFNYLSTFLNISYGGALKVGGFLGYAKNLGTSKALYNYGSSDAPDTKQWGRFLGNTELRRASVHVMYTIKHFSLLGEFEMTSASYGVGERNLSNGLFTASNTTTNNRFNLAVVYKF